MCEFTVISNHDCQVTCDHVYAVNADAALIMVAAARPGAEIIVAIPGQHNDLCFAGEGMVDGSQLIENAGGNDAQMDVLRSGLSQEGFEIQQGDTGRYFWKSRSGEGPQCDTEAEAIDTCFVMNHLVFPFNEDGSLGTKITAGKETAVTASSKPEGTRKNIVTYHLRAFAPDPRDGDCFFYYDDKVDRTWPIDSGEQFDLLMKGLSKEVCNLYGVYCPPDSFILQELNLLGNAG